MKVQDMNIVQTSKLCGSVVIIVFYPESQVSTKTKFDRYLDTSSTSIPAAALT